MGNFSWSHLLSIIAIIISIISYWNTRKINKERKVEKWNEELNIKHTKFQEYINSQVENKKEKGQWYDKWERDQVLKNHFISILNNEKDVKKIKNIKCSNCKNIIQIEDLIKLLNKNNKFKIDYVLSFQDLKCFYVNNKELQHTTCFWEYPNCLFRQEKNKVISRNKIKLL